VFQENNCLLFKLKVTQESNLLLKDSQQRRALANKISKDVHHTEPSELIPGFADSSYDRIVTQPPNSTIFVALGDTIVLARDPEAYFLVAHDSLFDPRIRNVNLARLSISKFLD